MSVHVGAKNLHIGCDEVYHLAECAACLAEGEVGPLTFVDHVVRVAKYAVGRHRVTPIIWDDMLRSDICHTSSVYQQPLQWTGV